jgi:hypothetical protein
MIRSIAAVIAGLAAAFVVIEVLEAVNSFVLFPFPRDVNVWDMEALKRHIEEHGISTGALLGVLAASVLAALAAGAVAALTAGRAPLVHAAIVAVPLELGAILNLQMIPHPLWFWFALLPVYFPAALLGAAVVARRSRRAGPEVGR